MYPADQRIPDGLRRLQILQPGDRVFIFGFSRGAFTARGLTGPFLSASFKLAKARS